MSESNRPLHPQELARLRGLLMTRYVVATVDISTIRQTCLANIVRWRSQGTNSILWDEWVKILIGGTDQKLIDALTDDIEESNRNLRRAGPYAGLINPKVREYIFSKPLNALPTLEELVNSSIDK
jgi:hypothetical protein